MVVSSGLPMALGEFRRALRMDEQGDAQLLGLGPHRVELRVGELDARHGAADRRPLQPLLPDRRLELLHGEGRILQGERGEGCEPVGLGGTELGQLVVLDRHDLGRQIAIAAVPERVDRQDLHVDRLGIHGLQPVVDLDEGLRRAVDRRREDRGLGAEQRTGFAKVAVGMDVDGLDPLAVDGHGEGAAPGLTLGLLGAGIEQAAAAEDDSGCRGSRAFEEVPTGCHGLLHSWLVVLREIS
jgi:hypothetical protein